APGANERRRYQGAVRNPAGRGRDRRMTRLLLTGASGQLGAYLLRHLAGLGRIEVIAWSGASTGRLFGFSLGPIDLADSSAVLAAFRATSPDVVIHAAALARLADCQRDQTSALQIHQ